MVTANSLQPQTYKTVEGSSPHMQNIHCANIIVTAGSETRPLWWSQTDYLIQILSATQGTIHAETFTGVLVITACSEHDLWVHGVQLDGITHLLQCSLECRSADSTGFGTCSYTHILQTSHKGTTCYKYISGIYLLTPSAITR